jgi:hypothetical protein
MRPVLTSRFPLKVGPERPSRILTGLDREPVTTFCPRLTSGNTACQSHADSQKYSRTQGAGQRET